MVCFTHTQKKEKKRKEMKAILKTSADFGF